MSDRMITRQFVVADAYQVFKTFRTREEAVRYARAARGFAENVTVTETGANR